MKNSALCKMFVLILAIVICAATAIGGTVAWFTAEVSTTGSVIKSGSLDVEMSYSEELAGPYMDVKSTSGSIFTYDKWEPGYTDVRYIKIRNTGSLSFEYELDLIVKSTSPVFPSDTKLAEVLDVYYLPAPDAEIAGRTLDGMTNAGTLDMLLKNNLSFAGGVLLPAGEIREGFYSGDIIVAVALHMQEDAGNEYMNKSIGEGFEIRLRATQYTYEEDAFDNLYDSNSPWDFVVSDVMLNYDPCFIPEQLVSGAAIPSLYDAEGNAVVTIPDDAVGYDYLFGPSSTLWIESDDDKPSSSQNSTDIVAKDTFKAGKHYFLCIMLTADIAGGYELDNPISVSDNTGAEYIVEAFKYPGYIDEIRAYRYIGQATGA